MSQKRTLKSVRREAWGFLLTILAVGILSWVFPSAWAMVFVLLGGAALTIIWSIRADEQEDSHEQSIL